jgi:hypothetical protein
MTVGGLSALRNNALVMFQKAPGSNQIPFDKTMFYEQIQVVVVVTVVVTLLTFIRDVLG